MGMSLHCPPHGVNGEALRVAPSVEPGHVAGIPSQRSARMSGNDVGLVAASRAAVVSHVGISPDSLIPSRIAALSTMYASQHVTSSDNTPIAAENKNARPTASLNAASMVAPVVVPSIITKRLSNLDCHSKLVKRGRKVSYQGFRGLVVRVSRGRCLVGYLDAYDRFTGWSEWVICERLQVVG